MLSTVPYSDCSVCCTLRIGRDLAEARDRAQAVGFADGVVIGESMVAAALDIERRQVQAALPRCAEEEVAQAIDDLVVVFLRERRGGVLQNAVDSRLLEQSRD